MSETTTQALDLNVTPAPTLPIAPPPVVVAQPVPATAESPVVTPKKRGRPRKAPVPEGETPPKRRRGRPRKSETEAKLAAENAAAIAAGLTPGAAPAASPAGETPKKKRGRPKKEPGSEGPPKKRGRPRKVREEGADAKPADTTPKKRGRPRKNPVPVPPAAAATAAGVPATAAPQGVPQPQVPQVPQMTQQPMPAQQVPITNAPVEVPMPTIIAPNGGGAVLETKESYAVGEPRMESRKRRRAASKSPAREKKVTKEEPARKKLRGKKGKKEVEEEEKKKKVELDIDRLDTYSLEQLQTFARELKINMKLYGDRKDRYIYAILLNQLNALSLDELKAEVKRRAVSMEEYGNSNKRRIDYIHALIDKRMGKEGEPLWQLWKDIYLVGTEWENYDSVFDVDWDFDHLKEALEEDGDLYEAGSKHAVYLFGVTEPQLVKFREKDRVVPIPAIVAVISSLPPPAQLGLKSVQKIEEEFVPMKELKMDWVPYIPKTEWKTDPKSVVPRAFFLKTHQRREGLKDMSEEELAQYNYALPYIFLPRVQEEPKSDTVVNVVTEVNGKGATFEFDWAMDDVEEIAADTLKENDLDPEKDEKQLQELIKVIKDTVNAEKKRIREEKAAWKAKIDGIGAEKKKALDELKIWKYYPQNEYPDVSGNKVAYVNRYYGKADKVL